MKSVLLILTIGAILAMVYATPSRSSLKAMLQNMGDDGGKKEALNQMDGDDDLNQILLESIQVMMQEDGDGDGDVDKAKAEAKQYHYFIPLPGKKG